MTLLRSDAKPVKVSEKTQCEKTLNYILALEVQNLGVLNHIKSVVIYSFCIGKYYKLNCHTKRWQPSDFSVFTDRNQISCFSK